MTTALIYFGASSVALAILSGLYLIEDAQGKRVLLVSFRGMLDRGIGFAYGLLARLCWSVWHSIAQFVLRYGVHRLLGAIVSYLKGLEQKVEDRVMHHRYQHAREKRPRTHLDEIADHKESTALSDEQKRRLKDD